MTKPSPSPLIDPQFRFALAAMVRRRVPESEAEDIVQATLAEAVGSASAPSEPEALRRWVWGIARHKVVDWHRRAWREQSADDVDVPQEHEDHDAPDLLRWVEAELPPGSDARRTFEWMLRESDGEKLESIAESEQVPAPRVRQRVSRLRRHFRTRWALEAAALAALGLIVAALVVYALVRRRPATDVAHDRTHERAVPEPSMTTAPTPVPTELPAAPTDPVPPLVPVPSSSASPPPSPRARPTTTATATPTATSAPTMKPRKKTTETSAPGSSL